MAGYTRQSIADIINGLEVTAPPLNAEFNQMAAAFVGATGHSHDGTDGNAPKIDLTTSVDGHLPAVHGGVGGQNKTDATTNPIVTNDNTQGYAPGSLWLNNSTGRVFLCVGNTTGAAVWREVAQITENNVFFPETNDSVDLGTTALRFRNLFLSGGLTMSGNASVGGTLSVTGQINADGGVAGDVTGNVTGDLTGNVTAASGSSTFNNVTVNGTADFTNTQLQNVSAPTIASHAATKGYVDTEISNLIGGAPTTLDTLNEIAESLNDDANAFNSLDTKIDTKVSKAGDTMSGNLAMGANKVTGLAAPSTGTDAVNLTYVTNLFGSTSSAAISAQLAEDYAEKAEDSEVEPGKFSAKHHAAKSSASASAAATSESNAASSAANASASETNAAASASAAATSETNAATSETNAAASASAAATSETNAATSETNAANSASAASNSEGNAATSASNAATSETNAANSASAAATSESNAATSEANAANSASAAASSAAIIDTAKLDGIETNADVTDTANVTAAGALMDSELTSEAAVKALDQGVATTDSPDFAGLSVDTNTLYVDSANDRVGIGTSSPQSTLDVNGTRGIYQRDSSGGGLVFDDTDTADTSTPMSYIRNTAGALQFGRSNRNASTGLTTNSVESMRIDSSGNVGIGTSSPSEELHVVGTVISTGGRGTGFGYKTADWQIYNSSDFGLVFDNNSERMRIDSSGNVGIGTSSPSGKLDVNTDTATNIKAFAATNGQTTTFAVTNFASSNFRWADMKITHRDGSSVDTTPIVLAPRNEDIKLQSQTAHNIVFGTNASEAMRIASSGNVGIGTSNPFYTLSVRQPTLGTIAEFRTIDGSNPGLEIKTSSSGTTLAQVYSSGAGANLLFETNASERMRIDSSGNVGIGTSSPDHKLHVQGSNAGGEFKALELWNNTTDTAGSKTSLNMPVYNGTTGLSISQFSSLSDSWNAVISTGQGSSSLIFESGFRSEAMRIDSSGNVLVGTTSVVDVASGSNDGTTVESGGQINASVNGGFSLGLRRRSNDGAVTSFHRDTTQVGTISVTSSTTSYNTSSDERLKENIADAQPASDLIDGIQVREFDWKADGEHQRYGMVAQELETVAPEAVTKGETEDDMWSVDYSKLVPMLVKEIQDLRKRVADLET